MATPVIYRWDDAGAPQFAAGADRTFGLANLLNKCLVTGYGSKPAAGWSLQFDSIAAAGKAVFRPESLEFGLRINDAYSTSVTHVGCADAWSDVDTPARLWTNRYKFLMRSPSGASTTKVPWVVIASPNFFWLLAQTYGSAATGWTSESNHYGGFLACGKYSAFHGEPLNNVLVGSNSSSLSTLSYIMPLSSPVHSSSIEGECYFQRGVLGETTDVACTGRAMTMGRPLYSNGTGYSSAYTISGNTAAAVTSSSGTFVHVPLWMGDYLGLFRGEIPYLRAVLARYTGDLLGNAGALRDVTVDGKTFLSVCVEAQQSVAQRAWYLFDVYRDDWP